MYKYVRTLRTPSAIHINGPRSRPNAVLNDELKDKFKHNIIYNTYTTSIYPPQYTCDRLDLMDICLSPCDDVDDDDRIALGCMPIA